MFYYEYLEYHKERIPFQLINASYVVRKLKEIDGLQTRRIQWRCIYNIGPLLCQIKIEAVATKEINIYQVK